MSQQEFQAQSQEEKQNQAALNEDRKNTSRTQSYYRSRKNRTGAMPKSEHPSTFNEMVPPYSYQAQDGSNANRQQEQPAASKRQEQRARRQDFSPDGDAFETGYRPYARRATQNYAPLWARPQRHSGRTILFALLAILLIPLVFKLLVLLLSLLAFFFVGFLFLGLILALIVLMALYALRRSLHWPRRTLWW
jgi:hypothetical protein